MIYLGSKSSEGERTTEGKRIRVKTLVVVEAVDWPVHCCTEEKEKEKESQHTPPSSLLPIEPFNFSSTLTFPPLDGVCATGVRTQWCGPN